ncbi:Tfp pilus assembly protein PilO [Lysinibacillus composti]|nr:potassium transporter [Lysinibacillus composti]MBM7608815.1 Tfp pilus assembly protein PilO [Lysinibacillus composti]
MKISSSKNSAVLLLTALVATLIFAVYYYVVIPKKDEAEMLSNSVSSLQSEITTYQEQLKGLEDTQAKNTPTTFNLRKKVPQSREIDGLLLNIEEIAYVTESNVQSINFNNYDSLVSESGYIEPETQEETSSTETEGTETTDPEAIENGEAIQEDVPISTLAQSLPPELKLITFNLEIESPDYTRLQQFIKEIEDLERVMHIDTISYSLPGEENEFAEDASDVATASVQVTTFYYEGEQ